MDRSAAEQLIAGKYARAYRAAPSLDYPHLHAQHCRGRTIAALGYRRAAAGSLFLEAYLDAPVETVLADQLGRAFARHDIVEIGNLASDNAPAMVALWAATANDLGGEAEVAVAVLTAPLRAMFHRLGLQLHALAPARASRILEGGQWGDYYNHDPVVCAGYIAEGQAKLARFAARLERRCA